MTDGCLNFGSLYLRLSWHWPLGGSSKLINAWGATFPLAHDRRLYAVATSPENGRTTPVR
jgi:hypothetical protein